jgi:hypothetical protein
MLCYPQVTYAMGYPRGYPLGSVAVIHRLFGRVSLFQALVQTLDLVGPHDAFMWITPPLAATMAAVFASPPYDLGDIRVRGTLAAVRGASAR